MWVRAEVGEVISTGKWSETEIYSSGGGGAVDPKFGGHVRAPQIHSASVERAEIFVKKADGKEESLNLTNINVPLRKGSKILYAFGTAKNENMGNLLVLKNIDTGASFKKQEILSELNGEVSFGLFWGLIMPGLVWLISWSLSISITGHYWFSFFIAIIAPVSYFILYIMGLKNRIKASNEKNEQILKEFSNSLSKEFSKLDQEINTEIFRTPNGYSALKII